MRVALNTLGCKVNQVETEQIKEDFIARGYQVVDFDQEADIYIVNTCTLTHTSDRKSRALLRRAVRRNPQAIVAAIGCVAQVNAEQLAGIDGVNLVIGNDSKENLLEIIEGYLAARQQTQKIIHGPIHSGHGLKPVLYTNRHKRTRAFIKIQDGCESFCSYCIVPYARGPMRSKSPENVLAEIEHLAAIGYREIVLTGIHTGFYGAEMESWNLTRLLHEIFSCIEGDYRIRLSSIEALEVSDELLEIVASEPRMCRHLHIPLQSGSDRILKLMNRRYDRMYYRHLLERAARWIPDIALTADVMVGFPGETDDDFNDTLELLRDLPMYSLHVFSFSPRSGTRAASMTPAVDEKVKHNRSQQLLDLAQVKRQEFIHNCMGREMEILIERQSGKELYRGLSDNYIEVELYDREDKIGQFVKTILGEGARAVDDAVDWAPADDK